jgi:hypothetical protein
MIRQYRVSRSETSAYADFLMDLHVAFTQQSRDPHPLGRRQIGHPHGLKRKSRNAPIVIGEIACAAMLGSLSQKG